MLLAGSSVSMLGSRVAAIGYPMLVLYITGSPVDAGWVAFAAMAPSILVYMPAGALVDRWDPRRVMLLSEIGRGLAIASVVVMVALGRPSMMLLIVAAIIEEILEIFSTLAERRYIRALVPRGQASAAQVRIEARTHVVVLMGRPLGGLLFEITPIGPFLANVATFVISVAALFGIETRRPAERATVSSLAREIGARGRLRRSCLGQPRNRQLRNDISEGVCWLWGNGFARTAMALSESTTLICQATIMVFLAVAHSRQMSSIAVGTVLAASGLGGAVGSFVASRLPAWSTRSLIQVQMWFWSAAFAVLAISGGESPFWMGLVMAVLGFTGAMGNIEVGTYLIQHVAENMLARVTSIGRLMSFAAGAIGPVVGGFLFQRYGVQDTVNSLLIVTMLLAIYSLFTPSMRARGSYAQDRPRDPAPGESVPALPS
jgi:MFS family permease